MRDAGDHGDGHSDSGLRLRGARSGSTAPIEPWRRSRPSRTLAAF